MFRGKLVDGPVPRCLPEQCRAISQRLMYLPGLALLRPSAQYSPATPSAYPCADYIALRQPTATEPCTESRWETRSGIMTD